MARPRIIAPFTLLRRRTKVRRWGVPSDWISASEPATAPTSQRRRCPSLSQLAEWPTAPPWQIIARRGRMYIIFSLIVHHFSRTTTSFDVWTPMSSRPYPRAFLTGEHDGSAPAAVGTPAPQ